jgi:hypothetical protein
MKRASTVGGAAWKERNKDHPVEDKELISNTFLLNITAMSFSDGLSSAVVQC